MRVTEKGVRLDLAYLCSNANTPLFEKFFVKRRKKNLTFAPPTDEKRSSDRTTKEGEKKEVVYILSIEKIAKKTVLRTGLK